MATLIIKDVDLEMLETQRKALNRTVESCHIQADDETPLRGLESMLDAWSDDVYRRRKDQELYLDYVNNFITVEKFAEHHGLTADAARMIIEKEGRGEVR